MYIVYRIMLKIHGLTEFLNVKTEWIYLFISNVNKCFEEVGLTFYFCSRPRVMYLSQKPRKLETPPPNLSLPLPQH